MSEDEQFVRVVGVCDDTHPRLVGVCPPPRRDFCERGLRFGPHNLTRTAPAATAAPRSCS